MDRTAHLRQKLEEQKILRGHPEKSLLDIAQLDGDQLARILDCAHAMKARPSDFKSSLSGKKIVLLFQKTSTRTKESFWVGSHELGMFPSYIDWTRSNFTLGALEDEIKVLSQWYEIIVARVYKHEDLVTMKQYSEVPIINGLCDRFHPCQALTDLLTIQEFFGRDLAGLKLAYIGDGNNVCNSLIQAASLAGISHVSVATPEGYRPLKEAEEFAAEHTSYQWTQSPYEAVEGAHIVYTDTWVSMGQEEETEARLKIFKDYQVNAELMKRADPNHIFMHDLPAHPGLEVTADVLRGERSVIFTQAQNRNHAQKALMHHILKTD